MKKSNIFIIILSIPHYICLHMVGENYTRKHKTITGISIMIVGSVLHLAAAGFTSTFITIAFDCLQGLLHGIGAIPIVENFIVNNQKSTK